MTKTDDLVRAMGAVIAHCTAKTNAKSILERGLICAKSLAVLSTNNDPERIVLRNERIELRLSDGSTARLNHQKPIRHGLPAAYKMLDGHTPESWAAQLDQRIFFWPERHGKAFAKSIGRDHEIITLWLDTRRFVATFLAHIDLCPINSGNFLQGGANARRGDWIYAPAQKGYANFRTNRMERGYANTKDSLKEISLRVPVASDVLRELVVSGP